ncbi:hypothetical protein E5288_WYG002944 [Bos mutus]|uniref:Uncharacterized protein n=1 Tax=Bos mutus TaxID=72004 RepID=A0A6B0SI32_9CETA|nr:hypothetical protein [Bos mutus]
MAIDGNHSKKAMSGARFVPAKLPPGRCAGLRKRAGPPLPTLTFRPRTSALAQTPSSARGLPVQRRLRGLPSTSRPWTASRLRPSRCSPRPSHGRAGGGGGRPSRCPFKSLPSEAPQGDPGGGGSSTLSFRSSARSRAPRVAPPTGGAWHFGFPDALAAAVGLPASPGHAPRVGRLGRGAHLAAPAARPRRRHAAPAVARSALPGRRARSRLRLPAALRVETPERGLPSGAGRDHRVRQGAGAARRCTACTATCPGSMRPATRGSSTPLRSRCCATRHGAACSRMDENYNLLPHGVNFQDAIFPDTQEKDVF